MALVDNDVGHEARRASPAGKLNLTPFLVMEFRQLMEQRRITVLCERGVGEDAGRFSCELLLR
jgi:hypothetical protein